MRPLGGPINKAFSPNTSVSSETSSCISTQSYTEPAISEALLQTNGRLLNEIVGDVSIYQSKIFKKSSLN